MTDIGWIPAELDRRRHDAEALHRLALLSGIGLNTPYDPGLALARLRASAALGHETATASLALLEDEAGGLEAWFRPPPPRVASKRPHVVLVDGFVSPAVCDWIRGRAEPHLKRAEIYDPVSGAGRPDPVRTNTAHTLDLAATDLVLVLVRERIARLAGLPVPGLEPSQVLRYAPGQKFDWHVDFLDPSVAGHRDNLIRSGQRIATCLIWLNDDYEGGETAFETDDQRFRGRKGDAILWANVMPNGAPDPLTRHAGLPPTSGEKWILSQWMRPRAPVHQRTRPSDINCAGG